MAVVAGESTTAASSDSTDSSVSPPGSSGADLSAEGSAAERNAIPERRDRFVTLQAILAGLPMYALRGDRRCDGPCCCASRNGGCLCCCQPKVIDNLPWVLPCHERVEIALLGAKSDYPQFRHELARLRVAHASHDLTIFVDDQERRMFTSLRGTDWGTCRDLSNDIAIVFGCWLCRTKWAREEYCHTRRAYPHFRSYGCGHSLGGTVMTELAHMLESEPEFAFERVDVFNMGGSPFAREYSELKVTQYCAHRVQGDLVSKYFRSPGQLHEYPPRGEFCSHSLRHFLPEPDQFGDMLHAAEAWVGDCCTGMGRRVHEGTEAVSRGVHDGAVVLVERAISVGEIVAAGAHSGADFIAEQLDAFLAPAHEEKHPSQTPEDATGLKLPRQPPSARVDSVGTDGDAGGGERLVGA